MVRINLIDPRALADQHLIAEYNEILMFFGYMVRYPEPKDIPAEFTLNKGHIKFFKNKLEYVKKRHERIKKEMRRRGFATNKTVSLQDFDPALHSNWRPKPADIKIIKKRIIEKLKMKPGYYRYEGEYKSTTFLVKLIREA